jgi:hypothetical protein
MNPGVTRVALLLTMIFAIASCQKQIKGDDDITSTGLPSPVEIRFRNTVTPYFDLMLDSVYSIGLGFYTVSDFKYYISNIQFVSSATGDTIKIPDTYFLIEHKKPQSKAAQFKVPSGGYYGMSFMIGIDSAKNLSGPHTGALDPALGMFWNKDDGYVMAVMEGKFGANRPPADNYSFRIGGTRAPYNVLSRRHFKLGGAIAIDPTRTTVINMTADAREWLSGPNSTGWNVNPIVNAPGEQAFKISQNYYKMFDFVSVKFE